MDSYEVELEQLGSKGTVLITSNFGFAVLADYKKSLIPAGRRPRPGMVKSIMRVLELLSPCHQAKLELKAGEHRCHVCGELSPFPADYILRSYPEFDEENQRVLRNLMHRAGVHELDTVILAQGLADILDELWSGVAETARVRQVLARESFSFPRSL